MRFPLSLTLVACLFVTTPCAALSIQPFLEVTLLNSPRSVSLHPSPQTIGWLKFHQSVTADVTQLPITVEFEKPEMSAHVDVLEIRNLTTHRTMNLSKNQDGQWIARDFVVAEDGEEWAVRMYAKNLPNNTRLRLRVDAYGAEDAVCTMTADHPTCPGGMRVQDLMTGDLISIRPGKTLIGRWTRVRGK